MPNQEKPIASNGVAHLYRYIFETLSDGVIINDAATGLVVDANPAACDLHGYPLAGLIGLHPIAYIHPDDAPQWGTWVLAAQAGEDFAGTVVHLRRDGSPFIVDVRGRAGIYEGRPCLISTIRNVSARVQAERQLRQQVVNHAREQSTLLEISQALAASTLELEPGVILDQLQGIVEHSNSALFTLEGLTLTAQAACGSDQLDNALPFRIELAELGTLTLLSNGHRPQRIANVQEDNEDAPTAETLRDLFSQPSFPLLKGMKSWMWVPLVAKGQVVGGIGLTHTEPDEFSLHDANLALTVANQAAVALINSQLYEQAQELAAFDERQRLAHNLHDAVNQSLFSASMIAEVLPRLWKRKQQEGLEALEDLRRLIRGALAEMRGLLAELRPIVLTDTELGDLLRQLGDALTGRINVPVSVNVSGKDFLSAEERVVFYRLCQEALNNIAKHAQPARVEINLHCDKGTIEMKICDNGRGFDPQKIPTGHYGLTMMQERAKEIGATLSITSQVGKGTEVLVRWTEPPAEENS
jgi:two-component system nitrate/nitrite sensor histidine kinase NarX